MQVESAFLPTAEYRKLEGKDDKRQCFWRAVVLFATFAKPWRASRLRALARAFDRENRKGYAKRAKKCRSRLSVSTVRNGPSSLVVSRSPPSGRRLFHVSRSTGRFRGGAGWLPLRSGVRPTGGREV